jgi:hypothetical protein
MVILVQPNTRHRTPDTDSGHGLAIGVMMGTVGYGLGAKDEHQVCAARERALNRRHQCTN